MVRGRLAVSGFLTGWVPLLLPHLLFTQTQFGDSDLELNKARMNSAINYLVFIDAKVESREDQGSSSNMQA